MRVKSWEGNGLWELSYTICQTNKALSTMERSGHLNRCSIWLCFLKQQKLLDAWELQFVGLPWLKLETDADLENLHIGATVAQLVVKDTFFTHNDRFTIDEVNATTVQIGKSRFNK